MNEHCLDVCEFSQRQRKRVRRKIPVLFVMFTSTYCQVVLIAELKLFLIRLINKMGKWLSVKAQQSLEFNWLALDVKFVCALFVFSRYLNSFHYFRKWPITIVTISSRNRCNIWALTIGMLGPINCAMWALPSVLTLLMCVNWAEIFEMRLRCKHIGTPCRIIRDWPIGLYAIFLEFIAI